MAGLGPTVTRRRLRAELRRLRLKKGLSIDEITNEVEWSTSKLVRIENGQVGISKTDLAALVQAYGVDDRIYIEELQELARSGRQRTWWSSYQQHILPPYREFLGAEADAAHTRQFQAHVLPGLLQTRDYAIAINKGTRLVEVPEETAEAAVAIRMRRQKEVLLRADFPIEYSAVIDESALHRPIGGKAVMRRQLEHLIELSERDNVSIAVLPYSAGAHPGIFGAFAIFEYADPADDDLVYLDSPDGGVNIRDQPALVDQYKSVYVSLDRLAMHDRLALDFIRKVQAEFT